MAVTLQQIAEAAGVSRGTVDRAMNNRGRINPQVAERIKKLAAEMGYQPNRAGRALAMSRKAIRIGMIFQASETPYMKNAMEGAKEAIEEVERLGAQVVLKALEGWDAENAVRAMRELRDEGCDGIAMVPVDDEELRDTVEEFAEAGIPVVTFNSDIEDSRRLCFVGHDPAKSGKTAAGLMAEILPSGGKVLVITGYPTNRTHMKKANSFREELQKCRPDIQIPGIQYAFDNDNLAEMITEQALQAYPDLAAIYLATRGVCGACRALDRSGRSGIKVISNDLVEANQKLLREGKVQFLVAQDDHREGYEPVMLLFEKLFDGKEPEKECDYTEIVIKTKYNL